MHSGHWFRKLIPENQPITNTSGITLAPVLCQNTPFLGVGTAACLLLDYGYYDYKTRNPYKTTQRWVPTSTDFGAGTSYTCCARLLLVSTSKEPLVHTQVSESDCKNNALQQCDLTKKGPEPHLFDVGTATWVSINPGVIITWNPRKPRLATSMARS